MIRKDFRSIALLLAASVLFTGLTGNARANAQGNVLHVYGPGGPAPAMHAVAAAFSRQSGITVDVVAGPTPAWRDRAAADADLIFSGSENMLTDYLNQVPGIDATTIEPLYLRPAAILVHPGNPLNIRHFTDLLRPGVRVMVVQGAGQTGMWEDIAGRLGNLSTVRALRSNIVDFVPNSAAALARWIGPNPPDAWIIYNIWQIAHPTVAQIVPIEEPYAIYRDMGVALTARGTRDSQARAFYTYLSSPQAAAIFSQWGWSH